jgi:Zn-dependent protease with chaperone function
MAVVAVLIGSWAVLVGPIPVLLSRARWVGRSPRAAVMLWQAVGLAACLSAIGGGLALAVAPLGTSPLAGLADLWDRAVAGHPLAGLDLTEALGLTIAADVGLILSAGMLVTLVRTVRNRARHRALLDLVCHHSERVPGAVLLDHPRPMAYCLPGIRSRIVVSAGALGALGPAELGAVVAHERGHTHARHDLAMLPFSSMTKLLAWMPYARLAPGAVSELLEMAADDFATRSHGRPTVAAALVGLVTAGDGAVPACAFGAGGPTVERRIRRLVAPVERARVASLAAILGSVVAVAAPIAVMLGPGGLR